MGLFRLLLLFIIVWLVAGLVRRLVSRKPPSRQSQAPASTHMVRCERCGVFVPEGESVRAGGRVYCSTAHRDEDAQG